MHVFSETASIELLDGLACAFLALTASLRARSLGANLAGAIVLGCICGLGAGLIREFVLHGQQGLRLVFSQLPQAALLGAIAALPLFALARKQASKTFFFMDATSMSLAAALAASLAAPELGAASALTVGVIAGLLPGLIRDVALGDSAMFLEESWYAVCVILAGVCAIVIILIPAFFAMPSFIVLRLGEWAVVMGTTAGLGLRYWRGKSGT